ncbi:hypothetical protein F5148DRAFT_1150944 [Russula earlei]|uniref:Uncharacterized protein n=1 Tax=Russula earlei TaxID=71964 RepID=A0ACC0U2Z2_9AGAM|nr:hypothetical protein F5148DRAFT_1150944 [Russula earlei]
MPLFRTKENAQRKYIDLIKEAVAKWPNWDPPKNIYAGDFGTVDKKSGELTVEGNIYTHDSTKQIAGDHPPILAPEVDDYQIHSYEVRGLVVDAETGADFLGGPGVFFKGRWQFNSKRGAILLMHRPRMTRVPDEFFKASLQLPVLKGKCVVYQVWNCPGFYMYLSNRSSEQVTVRLGASVPALAAPGVNVNPSVSVSWVAEGCTGVRQYAYRDAPVYTPLFCLKSIRRPLIRRGKNESLGEEMWLETDVPWNDLDEEGATEPEDVYDNGTDDDDDD